jgi:hypothetical protein
MKTIGSMHHALGLPTTEVHLWLADILFRSSMASGKILELGVTFAIELKSY